MPKSLVYEPLTSKQYTSLISGFFSRDLISWIQQRHENPTAELELSYGKDKSSIECKGNFLTLTNSGLYVQKGHVDLKKRARDLEISLLVESDQDKISFNSHCPFNASLDDVFEDASTLYFHYNLFDPKTPLYSPLLLSTDLTKAIVLKEKKEAVNKITENSSREEIIAYLREIAFRRIDGQRGMSATDIAIEREETVSNTITLKNKLGIEPIGKQGKKEILSPKDTYYLLHRPRKTISLSDLQDTFGMNGQDTSILESLGLLDRHGNIPRKDVLKLYDGLFSIESLALEDGHSQMIPLFALAQQLRVDPSKINQALKELSIEFIVDEDQVLPIPSVNEEDSEKIRNYIRCLQETK